MMLSPGDLERLIQVKRLEIEKEKSLLGLASVEVAHKEVYTTPNEENKENAPNNCQDIKENLNESRARCDATERAHEKTEIVSPELERYIRRYLGLPVMLKTGEYSPNNPLLRSERDNRAERDVFIGLGEYDERKKSLRRLRQQEYREYLDQQAKKKKEEKEKAERELKLLEERERRKIEEIRERELRVLEEQSKQSVLSPVQAPNIYKRPLSVACQTDDHDFLPIHVSNITQAERELSPHTVIELPKWNPDERPIKPAVAQDVAKLECVKNGRTDQEIRRRSYGDFDDRSPCNWKGSTDDNKYRPSILDAEAVHQRNLKAQQEACERKQFYQNELKCQIEEQQRIREERKAREKMLEMAEIRRLEEQLRMLTLATGNERQQHNLLTNAMHENSDQYMKKQKMLLKSIDDEKRLNKLHKSPKSLTSRSDDTPRSKLPHYYKPIVESSNEMSANRKPFSTNIEISTNRKPFSTNIPETSIFSTNYDVDSYLRRNLNPTKTYSPIEKCSEILDPLPIPVLRHSPKQAVNTEISAANDNSEAMKLVEQKWQVPIVQRNIVKSKSTDGKNLNILTQLGSIRRQLQLEQLKLDKMLDKDTV